MKSIILIFILSIILAVLILSQSPKQESLATAFNGEKVYKNKIETLIMRLTFFVSFIIGVILFLWQYMNN
jgi:protein translocase, SecG subunit